MVQNGTVKAPLAYYLMERIGPCLWREHVHIDRDYEKMSNRSLPDWIDTFPWDFDPVTNERWEKIFIRFGGGDIDMYITRFNVFSCKSSTKRLPYYYGLETFFF